MIGGGPLRECGEDKPQACRLQKRLKLRQQMVAAAGKTESVSLSLFLEVNQRDFEEARLYCAKRVELNRRMWMGGKRVSCR